MSENLFKKILENPKIDQNGKKETFRKIWEDVHTDSILKSWKEIDTYKRK